jgi:site-specific recombinase XerD
MIVRFLLTGARLREIVYLDKDDIDLHQSTIRLHRKGGEVNILPLADTAKIELKAYLKQRRRRNRARALFISCRNQRISRGTVWYLVKKYLKKSRIKTTAWDHILCAIRSRRCFKSGRESKSHSESYEP